MKRLPNLASKEVFVVIFDGSEDNDAQLDVALLLSQIEMHAGADFRHQELRGS